MDTELSSLVGAGELPRVLEEDPFCPMSAPPQAVSIAVAAPAARMLLRLTGRPAHSGTAVRPFMSSPLVRPDLPVSSLVHPAPLIDQSGAARVAGGPAGQQLLRRPARVPRLHPTRPAPCHPAASWWPSCLSSAAAR